MLQPIDYRPVATFAWTFTPFAALLSRLEKAPELPRAQSIEFDTQHRARAVLAQANTSPSLLLAALDLTPLPHGIITLCGGAKDFPPDITDRALELFQVAVTPLVREKDLLIVDGGTQAGIMRVMGHALEQARSEEPPRARNRSRAEVNTVYSNRSNLLGFAPAPQVTYPGQAQVLQTQVPLDPNHSSFVLVTDVREWGDEVPCLFEFLDYLAGPKRLPVVNLVVNGGRITIKEVWYAMRRGRPIILLEGSGRATDVMVAALDGASQSDLGALVKHWGLAHTEPEQQEILGWLADIARYEKLERFSFLSERSETLKEILLADLGL